MDEHRFFEKLIPDRTTRATAGEFLCHRGMIREPKSSLVMLADVFPHLVMPVRPFVSALWTPIVQMMIDAAVPQDLGHSVGRPAGLPWTTPGGEPDIAARVMIEEPWVVLVRHVVH